MGQAAEKADERSVESKTLDELIKNLWTRGARCRNCTRKEDYVRRVYETKGWEIGKASSPDGTITMTKDEYITRLIPQYHDHLAKEGHALEGAPDHTDVEALTND